MTTPSRPTSATHVLRSPEDFLAAAPVLLGFWPEESVVMMTFGAARPFHARVDLPPLDVQDAEVLEALSELLAEPAARHGVRAAVLLYYAADRAAAESVHDALAPVLRREGIAVLLALSVDDSTFADLDDPGSSARAYDVEGHPFVLDAVVNGHLVHRRRADMVASLEADPARVARIESALAVGGLLDSGVPADGRAIRAHGEWVEATVRVSTCTGAEPEDPTVARLLWVLQAPRVRDAAWSSMSRASAAAHVRLWRSVVRAAPEPLVAQAAALLGWAAWLAGDGALAWAAVERCQRADPEHGAARDLASILQHAVAPETWTNDFDWTSGLPPAARGA